MGRYAELAETLVHGEFIVYGNDHRGHGPYLFSPAATIQWDKGWKECVRS
jgi:alpha-beta hydrolase superfamily lysophospholipase